MTSEQRAHEIRRLEGVRDKLLAAAPRHFYFRRLLLPLMLALTVLGPGKGVWEHSSQSTLGLSLLLGGFLALLALSTWKVWRISPSSGDKWAVSDSLGYEGDGPRDIQRKIDALRDETR